MIKSLILSTFTWKQKCSIHFLYFPESYSPKHPQNFLSTGLAWALEKEFGFQVPLCHTYLICKVTEAKWAAISLSTHQEQLERSGKNSPHILIRIVIEEEMSQRWTSDSIKSYSLDIRYDISFLGSTIQCSG